MSIGIYKITNKVNGKVYIDQSKNIEKRWKQHLGAKDNYLIHRAIRKYGKDNFSFEIVQLCNVEMLNYWEQELIEYYDCIAPKGYNLTSGGGQGNYISEETKKKMSESQIGKHSKLHKPHKPRKPNRGYKKAIWLTPEGTTVEMSRGRVHRFHSDWIEITD